LDDRRRERDFGLVERGRGPELDSVLRSVCDTGFMSARPGVALVVVASFVFGLLVGVLLLHWTGNWVLAIVCAAAVSAGIGGFVPRRAS